MFLVLVHAVIIRIVLAAVVKTMDSAIRLINHYPLDNSLGFATVYPVVVISPVDSAIHRLDNWGLVDSLRTQTYFRRSFVTKSTTRYGADKETRVPQPVEWYNLLTKTTHVW